MVLTVARTAGSPGDREGLTIFAVPKGTAVVESVTLTDSSKAARLTFDNVELDADAVVGDVDDGWSPLSRALNAGRAGAAAELVGVAAGASTMTIDYLKQRKQFGKLIGEFQALQHRAAHLYGEIEIARAAALKASELLDSGDAKAELMTLGRASEIERPGPSSSTLIGGIGPAAWPRLARIPNGRTASSARASMRAFRRKVRELTGGDDVDITFEHARAQRSQRCERRQGLLL